MSRWLTVLIALFVLAHVSAQVQAPTGSGAAHPAPASSAYPKTSPATSPTTVPRVPVPPAGTEQAADTDYASGPSTNQPPQIIVTTPSPAAPPWLWHDRVAWGASIILAVLGYVGILLALRTLKNIERNMETTVATAQAAMDTAQAAVAQTQAIVASERPWIVATVEPFLTMENSFKVMITNRGRTPARIVALVDQIRIVVDETFLPKMPGHDAVETRQIAEPLLLLPGESVGIRSFGRDDVKRFCESDEEFERVALWEATIFLYGRVTYRDMIAAEDKQLHETDWCCRYIHGDTKSALLIAGPPEYNRHT